MNLVKIMLYVYFKSSVINFLTQPSHFYALIIKKRRSNITNINITSEWFRKKWKLWLFCLKLGARNLINYSRKLKIQHLALISRSRCTTHASASYVFLTPKNEKHCFKFSLFSKPICSIIKTTVKLKWNIFSRVSI